MAKLKIIRVRDGDWCGLVYADGETRPALPLGEPTAEEYAQLCDDDAEGSNRHDFCGAHRLLLAAVLRPNVASPKALRLIMRDLAERGGLHNLKY